METPCIVSGPAFVSVEFRRGRRVELTYTGTGTGTVFVNGVPTCLGASCATVVANDVAFEVGATALDDYGTFDGFEGEGCTNSPCVIGPGSTPVALRVRFDSALAWFRTLDAVGQVLTADDAGIAVAIVGSNSILIDGTQYSVAPLAAPTFGMVLRLGWDGGTDWVLPLNSHRNQDGNPIPDFADIVGLSDGRLVLSGSCSQGRFNGAVECGQYPTPLVLFINGDGSLEQITTDVAFGGSSSQQATIFDLHEIGARLVGFRGVGLFAGLESGGLGYIERGDAGFSPVFSMPEMPADFAPILNHCSSAGPRLRCLFYHSGSFTLNNCSVGATAGSHQPVLIEFDGELTCQRGFRIRAPYVGITAPSATRDAGSLVYGITAAADFGSGLMTQTLGTWIAEWDVDSVVRLGQNTQYSNASGMPTFPVRVESLGNKVLTQTTVDLQPGYEVELFGVRHLQSAVSLDFLDGSDLSTRVRHWAFTDSSAIPMQLLRAPPFRLANGMIVVLVTGINVRFGTMPLSSDNLRHTHVVVLKP